jgi:homoserine dehydrogenase
VSDVIRVGIAGLGTVGRGVVRVLEKNRDLLARRTGKQIELVAVSARSRNFDRGINLDAYRWYDDCRDLAEADDIDLVVELIGGSEGVARELVERALEKGKHVVTANKALVAHHGYELAKLAEEAGAQLRFEAAVAGGIPIIKGVAEGLCANICEEVYGILNGTCNYILTEMEKTGREFDSVLFDAQRLGYAEADPSFDVDGIDSAHKIAILASICFGTRVDFNSVSVTGIRRIAPVDIEYAGELGYRIKLLGTATMVDGALDQRVEPFMVDNNYSLAGVEDAYNAIVFLGDFVEDSFFEGRGAGEGPTASSVVADIIDVGRGNITPPFGVPTPHLLDAPAASRDELVAAFYVRLHVEDEPGVLASISESMRDSDISIESLIQHGDADDGRTYVVLTTHETKEGQLRAALARLEKLETMVDPPVFIRIAAVSEENN